MKLWHVTQWGNKDEGVNGWDTQCIVAAPTKEAAMELASSLFEDFNNGTDTGCDTMYLMGDDGRPDSPPHLVVRVWVAFADNPGHYQSWHRSNETDKMVESHLLYDIPNGQDNSQS